MKAAVRGELGLPLVIKEVPLPRCSIVAERRSCSRRRSEPEKGAANIRLAASSFNLLIRETTKAGGAFHLGLTVHTIEWEESWASLPNGCGPAIEINDEFARSHECPCDRLHLEMQDEPTIC